MKQSYVGLQKIKKGLKGSLQNPNLTEEMYAYLLENLHAVDFYIYKIEDLFKDFGGI